MLTTLGRRRMRFGMRFGTRMRLLFPMGFLLDRRTSRLRPFCMRYRRLDRRSMLHFMLLRTRCGFRRGMLLLSVRRVHGLLLPWRLRLMHGLLLPWRLRRVHGLLLLWRRRRVHGLLLTWRLRLVLNRTLDLNRWLVIFYRRPWRSIFSG